jgi:hypothetical protein
MSHSYILSGQSWGLKGVVRQLKSKDILFSSLVRNMTRVRLDGEMRKAHHANARPKKLVPVRSKSLYIFEGLCVASNVTVEEKAPSRSSIEKSICCLRSVDFVDFWITLWLSYLNTNCFGSLAPERIKPTLAH